MTQEQKARAYDEALEKARKLYNDAKANEYKSDMEDYEFIFPELAESEDERIRRWLCDYFSSIDKAWIHKDITCIDILRWLEKQKELDKMIVVSPEVWDKAIADAYENGKKDGEKQKEQKPAEWSEEDEKMLQSIIKDFRAGKVSTIGQEQWLKSLL